MKKKIFENISWLFIDKVVRIFGGLIIGIWVARYLGPKNYGILNYSLAFVSFFTIFSKFGLDQIVVREVVDHKELSDKHLGSAFFIKFIGSIIAILLIYVTVNVIESDSLIRTVILLVALSFLFQAFDVIDFFFQAKILSKYVVISRGLAFFISSVLKIVLILLKYSVVYFAIVYTIDFLLSAIFMVYVYSKIRHSVFKWEVDRRIMAKIIIDSWPLALSTFLITVYSRIDQVMLKSMLNVSDVGVYSAAIKLSKSWMFIPQVIITTAMPYFTELRKKNKKLYYERLIQLYSIMFWMGVVVGIITVIIGRDIIKFLYGSSFIEAYYALIFNIWNGIFISQALARGIWLINDNLQKYRLYNNIFGVILNVVVNFLLIPVFGISGAAAATLITEGISTWGISMLWKPIRPSTLAMIKGINPRYLVGALYYDK